MLVKEHMRNQIVTISDDATFRDALKTMISNKTNGLIVIDKNNAPVGAIDSFHLINHMTPQYLRENPDLAQYEPEGVFHKSVSAALHIPVIDMMEKFNGVCVREDDRFIKVATLASKYNFRYIPVMNADDKLAGLVSRTDIKRAMASIVHMHDDPN